MTTIAQSSATDATVWKLEGPMTVATVPTLFAQHTVGGDVLVDCAAVTETDSSAVALLLVWRRQARQSGHRLHLRNLPASLTSLATLYGVSGLLAGD